MKMIPVESSDLLSVGYESNILYVSFRSGSTYCYYDVPENIYHDLLSASSKGKYFHAHIRTSFVYKKIKKIK